MQIMTPRMREYLNKSETVTITLPDGTVMPVSAMPPQVQQAIAMLDEWMVQQKMHELEIAKLTRAIDRLKAEVTATLSQPPKNDDEVST